MCKSADIGGSVGAGPIPNRDFDNLQIELCGAKKQIEVSKWVEFSKVRTSLSDPIIAILEQYLGPAKCVAQTLLQ